MQLYVQEAVRSGQQLGVGSAQNVVSISNQRTTNMILSYFVFEHWEQLVMDFDEHSDDISKKENV
jgi:hypothetical protein